MKRIMLIFMLVLLQATFVLSQIPDQPFQTLKVGLSIKQIAYSPDGNLLATACGDGLYLCDTRTWDEPRLLIKGNILSAAFSPDGKMLAAGVGWQIGLPDDWQETIYLWDLQNEKQTELKRRADIAQSVRSVCFSPDSQMLVSGDVEGVSFWDVERKVVIGQLPLGDSWPVYSLAYRHDGNMLAAGTYNTVYLVDPKEQKILSIVNERDEIYPEAWILCVGFSPDGTILASGSGNNVVNLWDVSNLKRIEELVHGGDVHFVSFTPDGRQIVYGGWNRVIHIHDMITKETIYWECTYPISSGALSPDGKTLAIAGTDWVVSFWRMTKPTTDVRLLNKKPVLWGMLKSGRLD